jgi:hypothetical protein
MKQHFDKWNPPAQYLPMVRDLLSRGWVVETWSTAGQGEPDRMRIEGQYVVNGVKMRAVLQCKRYTSYFTPIELKVEPEQRVISLAG